MTYNIRPVPIGIMVVTDTLADVLVAYGLGSCVAICMYDSVARVGGILHALLPTAVSERQAHSRPTKYVDQGIPLFIHALLDLGAHRRRMVVYLCGGADMLTSTGFENSLNIGRRNIQAATSVLRAQGLRIHARATGGDVGRTLRLYMETGHVTIKTMRQEERVLVPRRRLG